MPFRIMVPLAGLEPASGQFRTLGRVHSRIRGKMDAQLGFEPRFACFRGKCVAVTLPSKYGPVLLLLLCDDSWRKGYDI